MAASNNAVLSYSAEQASARYDNHLQKHSDHMRRLKWRNYVIITL